MTFKSLEPGQVVGKVSHIAIHPIKSAAMVELDKSFLSRRGLYADREFMVVLRDADVDGVHHFVTQRKAAQPNDKLASGLPSMALIKPELRPDHIKVTWNGEDPINIFYHGHGKEITVGTFGTITKAGDQGDQAANWFSEHLGLHVRLVWTGPSFERLASQSYMKNKNPMRFQDGYPVHWFTQQSVNELSLMTGESVTWRRFRPNFVIEAEHPQVEHLIWAGEINGIPFVQPKPCDRCPTTTVDQDKGVIVDKEPLRSLASYKKWRNNRNQIKVIFGENILPIGRGEIAIGSELVVKALRDPSLEYGEKI